MDGYPKNCCPILLLNLHSISHQGALGHHLPHGKDAKFRCRTDLPDRAAVAIDGDRTADGEQVYGPVKRGRDDLCKTLWAAAGNTMVSPPSLVMRLLSQEGRLNINFYRLDERLYL